MNISHPLKPRAFEHWDRQIGFGRRVKIQAYQTLKKAYTVANGLNMIFSGYYDVGLELRGQQRELQIRRIQAEAIKPGHDWREGKYRLLFDNAPIGFHTLNDQGEIVEVNKRWLEIMGYGEREVLGRSLFDFVQADQRDNARLRFQERLLYGRAITPRVGDRIFMTKDGSPIITSTHDEVIRDSAGKAVGVQTSFDDRSYDREREEQVRAIELRESYVRTITNFKDYYAQAITALHGNLELAIAELPEGTGWTASLRAAGDLAEYLTTCQQVSGQLLKMTQLLNEYLSRKKTTESLDLPAGELTEFLSKSRFSGYKLIDAGLPEGTVVRVEEKRLTRVIELVAPMLLEGGGLPLLTERPEILLERELGAVKLTVVGRLEIDEKMTNELLTLPPFQIDYTPLYEIHLRLSVARKQIVAMGGRLEVGRTAAGMLVVKIWLPLAEQG
ncbi:MAG: PAS domain S-box protein [Candidatus Margulisbacteria bacterium]|jgi:PAS domain S-box-containing protein|nr:PAS domain S-box protein [Candidatus Margulisiibacteriota bacterium]